MFCRNCGQELKEGWVSCPNCGMSLNRKEENEHQGLSEPSMETYSGVRDRKQIKEELAALYKTQKDSVIIFWGTGEISRDMERILEPGERMQKFEHAFRTSVIGQIKSLRIFRNYIAFMDRRLVYVESGRRAFSFIPFLRKQISIPYHEIQRIDTGKRLGIFSGTLTIWYARGKLALAVSNMKEAEEIKEFLQTKIE